MEPEDAILGMVAVERGWLSPEDLADCLRECAALSRQHAIPGSTGILSRILARRRLIPEEELDTIRAELSKVLRRGVDRTLDRQEDLALAQSLRDAGLLSQKELDEAIALERAARAPAPRLRQVLVERGFIAFSALLDALQARRTPGIPMICTSCNKGSTLTSYDPARVYLCRECTGELARSDEQGPAPPPRSTSRRSGPESARYQRLEEIGRGGMGVVYKAWDEVQQTWVALKVIKASGRLEETARFRREIEIARSLHHPNIVSVLDVLHTGDEHQIAMEYIEGTTIAGLRLPPKWAAELVQRIAEAVQYAHSRGVIHRDIKPQNIMVDRNGRPHLMDFGLAKSTDRSSSITSVGIAMGTPSYMSPEQALGKSSHVDRRSDVYSLGAVLYELLTGCPPFRGTSPLDTLQRVVDQSPIPPTQIDRSVPRDLERIVLKCLQKDKHDRYQTAKSLADDLSRASSENGGALAS